MDGVLVWLRYSGDVLHQHRVLIIIASHCSAERGGLFKMILCDGFSNIAIKRNTKMQPCASAVSMQPKRAIAVRYNTFNLARSFWLSFLLVCCCFCCRLRAVSFNEDESVFSCLNSGILNLNLSPDEVRMVKSEVFSCFEMNFLLQEHSLLKNLPNNHFPIYISVNFSLTSADT